MKSPVLYYNSLEEIAWIRDFEARLGITAVGYGSTQLNSIKESNLNKRLLKLTAADFYAKIKPQHGDKILEVKRTKNDYYDCDALIACLRSMDAKPLLISNTADCPTIAIADPHRSMLALIHSGWKGSRLNIVGKTIQAICDKFGLYPERLDAYVWPGICKHDYQVGPEFKDYFPKWVSKDLKLNLKGVIIDQLVEAGLENKRIHSTKKCSYCSLQQLSLASFIYGDFRRKFPLFYSYRRVHDEFNKKDQFSTEQIKLRDHLAAKRNCVFLTIKP